MTEQSKKLSKTQLKRWKFALKEAAKINRKLKSNKGSILIDASDNSSDNIIIKTGFRLITENGISTLGYVIGRCLYSLGDNNKEYNNGIMYSSLDEIRRTFSTYKVYKEIK